MAVLDGEGAAGAPCWFSFRYGALSSLLLRVCGCGPSRSSIVVGRDDIAVKMGVGFSGRGRLESLTGARDTSETVISRGVHGWRGDWLVNGAGDGLVEATFDPPMPAHVLGFPVKVRRLRVSVDDPAGLVESLRSAAGSG